MPTVAMRTVLRRFAPGALLAALLLGLAAACGDDGPPTADEPLRIGLLTDANERSVPRRQSFELAIAHLNEGGGVLGHPVEAVIVEVEYEPDVVLAAALRLVEEEGVHAIVGPSSSAASLPVAEQVAAALGVPVISPSASSPKLTTAPDGDFFFRTAPSDLKQGPVLARLTEERGFANVGVIHRDDAWGRGLAEAFAAAWRGPIVVVEIDHEATTFVDALRRSARGGAEALVVLTFAEEAVPLLREAVAEGIYDRFMFGDGARSVLLIEELGPALIGGMYGTAGAGVPESAAGAAWEAAWRAAHGELPQSAYVKESYDAAIALGLAAQAAGSLDGAAIRDQLRAIGSAPGEQTLPGPEGVADALRLLREGEEIDHEGASVPLDWDEHGDLARGHIGVWRYTADGRIEDLSAEPFE